MTQVSYHPQEKAALWKKVLLVLFGISATEASCAQRGFQVSQSTVERRLDTIGQTFLQGYHAALLEQQPHRLGHQLDAVALELRGFAYEGAGMSLGLLDWLTPWSHNRVRNFLAGCGDDHAYMVHVGVGWLLGRLPLSVEGLLARLDPLLGWLAVDGYGFHEGYFHGQRSIAQWHVPKKVLGARNRYTLHAFDQGLGRSLWFVTGTDSFAIEQRIQSFAPERQGDLWSGIGLACTYAGGCDRTTLDVLRYVSGEHLHHLAQGVAFAAKARQRAGNMTPHVEQACQLFWGMTAPAVAAICDRTLNQISHHPLAPSEPPAYEQWRQAIRQAYLAIQEAAV